jgi:hypothetical protein
VAEQGCLLSSYPDKIGIGGSNPPLSAIVIPYRERVGRHRRCTCDHGVRVASCCSDNFSTGIGSSEPRP